MPGRILLLGHDGAAGLAIAMMLARRDFEPLLLSWSDYHPRLFGRRGLDLVLADVDRRGDTGIGVFCRSLRKRVGTQLPIVAVTRARMFQDVVAFLDDGIDDCLPPLPDEDLLFNKIARRLDPVGAPANELSADLPASLRRALDSGNTGGRLGDVVAIYPGAAPRRPAFRRLAPPYSGWRGVVLADGVDRFMVGAPGAYLRWTRLHLFRLPSAEEYSAREKVLLRRAGPPLAAAVDRSRHPAGPDVYSLVPKDGIPAGFVACVLNSRLMDCYFNRVASAATDGRLRLDMLRAAPLPRADAATMAELAKTASLLAHFGPNPQSWIDRETRDGLMERMEELVFGIYGVTGDAREELAALHF